MGCRVLAPGVLASFAEGAPNATRGQVDDPANLTRQRVWRRCKACNGTAVPDLTRCPGEDALGILLAWSHDASLGAPLQPAVRAP